MPKGGAYIEENAVDDMEDIEEKFSAGDALIPVKNLNGIKERQPGTYPHAIERLAETVGANIRESTGVNVEMQGQSEKDIAGVVVAQRNRQAITTLAELFDSLRLHMKQTGLLTLEMLKKFMADDRLIRIVGQARAQWVKLTKESIDFEYDVVVDTAPDAPNYQAEVMQLLINLWPSLTAMGIPPPPDVFKYLPFPPVLQQAFADSMQGAMGGPPGAPPGAPPAGPPGAPPPGPTPGPTG